MQVREAAGGNQLVSKSKYEGLELRIRGAVSKAEWQDRR